MVCGLVDVAALDLGCGAFFTVAALAAALGLSLEEIARHCAIPGQESAAAVLTA
jgi:hypothetical protein